MRGYLTVNDLNIMVFVNLGTLYLLIALGKLPYPDAFLNDRPIWSPGSMRNAPATKWTIDPFRPLSLVIDSVQQATKHVEYKRAPSDVSFEELGVLLSALNKGKTLAKGTYHADIFDWLLNEMAPEVDYRVGGLPFWHAETVADYIVHMGRMLGFRVCRDSALSGLVRVKYVVQEGAR